MLILHYTQHECPNKLGISGSKDNYSRLIPSPMDASKELSNVMALEYTNFPFQDGWQMFSQSKKVQRSTNSSKDSLEQNSNFYGRIWVFFGLYFMFSNFDEIHAIKPSVASTNTQ